jgi:hypothetical protein
MKNLTLTWLDNQGGLSDIDARSLENNTVPKFLQLEGNLHSVRRNRYYDVVAWEIDTLVEPKHVAKAFRKGFDQVQKFATSNNEYTKTLAHTNMSKDGEFEAGSVVVLKNIEVQMIVTSGRPTAQSAGIVTNPKAAFTNTTIDPALIAHAWLNQTWIQFKRGKTIICEGLAIDFQQKAGVSGQLGGSAGGFVQNNAYSASLLPNVQVFGIGDDFEVVVTPLANFDLTSATGINREIAMKVVLDVIEAARVYEG